MRSAAHDQELLDEIFETDDSNMQYDAEENTVINARR